MSGEYASRSTLDLPGRQLEVLQAVTATGKPVVLVLLNGRPLDISWAAQTYPPSSRPGIRVARGGNAVADLLFGDAAPGGKLPFTWVKNAGQIPFYYSHNLTQNPGEQEKRYWNERVLPLYPFGHGLSYTTFAFSNLKVNQPEIKIGHTAEVTVNVKIRAVAQAMKWSSLYSSTGGKSIASSQGVERI